MVAFFIISKGISVLEKHDKTSWGMIQSSSIFHCEVYCHQDNSLELMNSWNGVWRDVDIIGVINVNSCRHNKVDNTVVEPQSNPYYPTNIPVNVSQFEWMQNEMLLHRANNALSHMRAPHLGFPISTLDRKSLTCFVRTKPRGSVVSSVALQKQRVS